MKFSIPKFTPITKKTNKPINKFIAVTYHTIIPIALVYVTLRTDNFLWLIPLPFILFIRLPEE